MKFLLYGVQDPCNRLRDYFTEDTIPDVKPCPSAIPMQHAIGGIWYWAVEINTMEELQGLVKELEGKVLSNPSIRFGNEFNPACIDFSRS